MRLILAFPLIASLTLACGVAQSPQPAAQGDSTPKYGGTLKARHTLDPYDWDVTYTGKAVGNREPRALASNSLLGFRAGPDIDYNQAVIRPELAERWEVSPDARTFTFHLRRGVKYPDIAPANGREFTAADVRFSFEYIARTGEHAKLPTSNIGWMLEGLDRIDSPDPYTAIVRFKEPFAPFLNYVSHEFVYIMPREIFDRDGHFKNQVLGTGMFQLDDKASQKGTRWVLKKNPGYWEPGRPYMDEVQMLVVPDDAAAAAAFQTKQIDLLESVPPKDAEALKAKAAGAVYFEYNENPLHVYINNSRPPFNNVKVRQALFHTVDRDEFIRVLGDGRGAWAVAGALPGTFTQEEIKAMVPKYDPAQSKRLLAEAGFPNGLTFESQVASDRGSEDITRIELMQSQIARGGFAMTIKGIPYSQFSPMRKVGEHTLQLTNRDINADVDSYIFATHHPSSGNNYDRINEPKLNDLLISQRREADPAKRLEIIRQAVRYLVTECFCGLAVHAGSNFDFWQPSLKNYRPNWHHNGWSIEESWLEK